MSHDKQFLMDKPIFVFDTGMDSAKINASKKNSANSEKTSELRVVCASDIEPDCHGVRLEHDLKGWKGDLFFKKGAIICPPIVLKYGKALYILNGENEGMLEHVMWDYSPGSIIILTGGNLKRLQKEYDATFHLDSDLYYQKEYNLVGKSAKIIKPLPWHRPLAIPLHFDGTFW